MNIFSEQVLLRAYLQSADRAPHTPTHERIVHAALKEGLAGATVLRGILGTGYHGVIKPARWSLVQHVPVVVEIVDSGDRIIRFKQEVLDKIMVGGMLTLERAAVMMKRGPTQSGVVTSPSDTSIDRLCKRCIATLPPDSANCPNCGLSTAVGAEERRQDPSQSTSLQVASELRPLSTIPHIEPGIHMKINENGILLRVFIGESDRFDGKPLYEAIIQKIRELGLAGGTVLRGSEGFGAHSVIHQASLLEMSTDLPIVVEVIDAEDKIRTLLRHLETMVTEGMITMEYVVVLMYRRNGTHETLPASPDALPPT